MEKTLLLNLDLRKPLFYEKTDKKDDVLMQEQEILLCFEVNLKESCNFEPKRENFLGKLVSTGVKSSCNTASGDICLPAGHYLFTQCRGSKRLDQDEWLDMAIEQQKDGLWERNRPGNMLFVRFLYEDEAFVTQIFRPVEK